MAKDFRKIPKNRLHWYAGCDASATLRLYLHQRAIAGPFERTWRSLHGPGFYALTRMERWGAVMDEGKVRAHDAHLSAENDRVQAQLDADGLPKEFNPRSPQQMQKLLFKELGFKPKAKTATGQPSVGAEVVRGLITEKWGIGFDAQGRPKGDAPQIAEKKAADRDLRILLGLNEIRDIKQQRSSYGLNALKYIGYDGRVHTKYKLIRTGRLSSSEPNLQNLRSPDDDDEAEDPGKRARGLFVVPDDDHVIISLDYSQIELRVAAMLAGDEIMAAAFEAGVDFHTATAARVFNKDPREVSKLERRVAKTINFGIVYGQTSFGLAIALGIPEALAQSYIDGWLRAYPKFAAWRKARHAEGYRTGRVWARWGDWTHSRPVVEMGEVGESKSTKRSRKHAENVCVNTPVQNVAVCFCLDAMASIVSWIEQKKVPAELNLQVHDALVLYARRNVWQEVAARCVGFMLARPSGCVKMKVDVEMGEADYGHLQSYKGMF